MPFGEYQDFEDCVANNQEKEDPEAYCAALEKKLTGEKSEACLAGPIVFKNAKRSIVTAAVLIPGELDSDGEAVTAEKIEDVALKWMEEYQLIDGGGHTFNRMATPVESWLTRVEHVFKTAITGEELVVPKGSWMLSAKVNEQSLMNRIESGEYSGFSVTGVRKTDLNSALKSADVDEALKAIQPRKTLLRDLGPDWIAASVAIVKDPAVFKSKWIAIKSKEESPGFMEALKNIFKKQKEEIEMTKEEILEMVQNAVKEALTPVSEAVKSLSDKVDTFEKAAKDSASQDDEKKDDTATDQEKETDEETATDAEDTKEDTTVEEQVEKAVKATLKDLDLEGILKEKIAAKSRAVKGQDGSQAKKANVREVEPIHRDAAGCRIRD